MHARNRGPRNLQFLDCEASHIVIETVYTRNFETLQGIALNCTHTCVRANRYEASRCAVWSEAL